MAVTEERQKENEIHGIVKYPWGTPHDQVPDLKAAIWRYPLLNEVGAAVWILAASAFEQGDTAEAKKWIRWSVENVPLHQISADERGAGYWNALVGWELNPGHGIGTGGWEFSIVKFCGKWGARRRLRKKSPFRRGHPHRRRRRRWSCPRLPQRSLLRW